MRAADAGVGQTRRADYENADLRDLFGHGVHAGTDALRLTVSRLVTAVAFYSSLAPFTAEAQTAWKTHRAAQLLHPLLPRRCLFPGGPCRRTSYPRFQIQRGKPGCPSVSAGLTGPV